MHAFLKHTKFISMNMSSIQSLLQPDQPRSTATRKHKKTRHQRAAKKTFKASAELSNLLPTGTILFFQTLSPVLTHQGKCHSNVNRSLTVVILSLCAVWCLFLSFTDSFIDRKGKVRYGVATYRGIWVIDSSEAGGGLSEEEAAKYKVGYMDFLHAGLSILVFGGVALFDKNVVRCFFSEPSKKIIEVVLSMMPFGITVICSLLFVLFPTKRHGIGYPLSGQSQ